MTPSTFMHGARGPRGARSAVLVWTEFSLLGRGVVHQCGVYDHLTQAEADRTVREVASACFDWTPPRWWQWWRRRDSDHPLAGVDPVRTDPEALATAVDQLLGDFHGARYREALEELIDLSEEWRDRLRDIDAAVGADPDELPEPGEPSFRRNLEEPADPPWPTRRRDEAGEWSEYDDDDDDDEDYDDGPGRR